MCTFTEWILETEEGKGADISVFCWYGALYMQNSYNLNYSSQGIFKWAGSVKYFFYIANIPAFLISFSGVLLCVASAASQLSLIEKPVSLWKKLFVSPADVSWCVVYWQLWLKQVTFQLEERRKPLWPLLPPCKAELFHLPGDCSGHMWGFQFARAVLESYLLWPVVFLMDSRGFLMAALVLPIPAALSLGSSPMPQVSLHIPASPLCNPRHVEPQHMDPLISTSTKA